jgi:hypothetical protein
LALVACVALLFAGPSLRAAPVVVNGDPFTKSTGALLFRVQGEFRPSIESARESVLHAAQLRLRDWLAQQNPPIRRVPSLDQIYREMKRVEQPPQVEQILISEDNSQVKMYKITMDVEFLPKQIRDLRERDRISFGMRTFGGLLGILGVAALLFRLDEWTKGYLTGWLMAAAAGLIGLVAALWWWGR